MPVIVFWQVEPVNDDTVKSLKQTLESEIHSCEAETEDSLLKSEKKCSLSVVHKDTKSKQL